MKKVIFTALTLIVCSGVGMANDKKERKDEIKINKKQSKRVLSTDCCALYTLAYNLAIKEGATPWQAGTFANMVENNCEKSNSKGLQ